jgi:hypothetical protein
MAQTKTPEIPQPTEFPEIPAHVTAAVTDLTKRVNAAYLDNYEKVAIGAADLQEQAAQASDVKWFKVLGTANAGLQRELTQAYTTAARQLVK